jgi:hypothetical protein
VMISDDTFMKNDVVMPSPARKVSRQPRTRNFVHGF